ncbi:MAG: APC family permease [Candidatus Caldarchaeum sp.]|nr:APC family permease [Candidatus Caldarchaeum sp.]
MGNPKEAGYKREVGWFGSFALGYGDVGPNIFIALGVITLFAGGAAPIAFLIAACLYAVVGLIYAELAPTYPYAGGVQVYAMKAYNTLLGFVAGWAMMLAYILCMSLFAVAAAGYLRHLFPVLMFPDVRFMGFTIPSIGVVAGFLASVLVFLNIVGIKYSSFMVSALVFVGLSIEALILSTGFLLKFDPNLFMSQVLVFGSDVVYGGDVGYLPFLPVDLNNFLYAVTLAMASFVGIESIAQAAEETRRPHFSLPKAAKMVVVVVAFSAVAFPVLSVGSMDWRQLAAAYENPVSALVGTFPLVADFLMPMVGFAAFILCFSSSNTGLVGVSRLTASMARFRLLPSWIRTIHPRFRTPVRAILFFGTLGVLLSFLGDIPLLASVYAFAAVISYVVLVPTYIRLRKLETTVYTPWTMPLTVKIRGLEIPLPAAVGFAGLSAILFLMLLFHASGRVVTIFWMVFGVALFAVYRKAVGARVVSGEEGDLVEPLSYRMKVGVLVRPYENMDTAYKSIVHAFDRRFDIGVVSIVEPHTGSSGDLVKIGEEVSRDLHELCKSLKKDKYNATSVVEIGDFEEKVSRMLEEGRFDLVAYIQRRAEKSIFEKGHEKNIHNLLTRYPGRVLSLKRVGE